jgi:hydroxyacylglutathione hydrolase
MIIHPIPAFSDNYIWCLRNETYAVIVDPGDSKPVLKYLHNHRLQLSAILITHHHADHIGGVDELLRHAPVPVYAPAAGQYAFVHQPCAQGDCVQLPRLGCELQVLDVPGHTLDHIAYVGDGLLFCGDTLFAGGCGRVFEGTYDMMYASLQKLAALPPETAVCCAHEYTLANLAFAQRVELNNEDLSERVIAEAAKRERGEPTVPSSIGLELKTNPFLRAEDGAEFARRRQLKDNL